MYFEGSVMGLNVGSPVLWQGVQIGSVVSITIIADMAQGKTQIPVVVDILPERFDVVRGERNSKNLQRLIDRGLRAVLVTQSLITGQLAIEVGFYPDTEVVLRKKLASEYEAYPEVPTIPSTVQKLMNALAKLDLTKIEQYLDSALDGISKVVNDPNLTAAIKDLKLTLQSAHKFIINVNGKVDPLTKDVNKATRSFDKLAQELDKKVKALSGSLEKTLADLDTTLSGFDKTMTSVRGVVSPNAPLVVKLENSLQEVARMSEAIRELADYLEEHPSSLIRGKKKPKGE